MYSVSRKNTYSTSELWSNHARVLHQACMYRQGSRSTSTFENRSSYSGMLETDNSKPLLWFPVSDYQSCGAKLRLNDHSDEGPVSSFSTKTITHSPSSSPTVLSTSSTIKLPPRPILLPIVPPVSRSMTFRGIGDTNRNLYSCR